MDTLWLLYGYSMDTLRILPMNVLTTNFWMLWKEGHDEAAVAAWILYDTLWILYDTLRILYGYTMAYSVDTLWLAQQILYGYSADTLWILHGT